MTPLARQSTTTGGNADLSRDMRFTDTVARGVSYSPVNFVDRKPVMSISVAHSGFNAGVTVHAGDTKLVSFGRFSLGGPGDRSDEQRESLC